MTRKNFHTLKSSSLVVLARRLFATANHHSSTHASRRRIVASAADAADDAFAREAITRARVRRTTRRREHVDERDE